MASDEAARTSVDSNKENSEEKDGFVGIEANDLATLLNRFEEATSSDDISVPRAVHKTKWNIMKAKSAGNSPAVTPPATPPPMLNDRPGSVRLKTFTQSPPVIIKKQTMPIKLTVVHPAATSTKMTTMSPSQVIPSSSFTKISTNSLISSQPKVHIQISNPSLPSSGQGFSKPVSKLSVLPVVISQSPVKNTKAETKSSPSFSSAWSDIPNQVMKIPFPSNTSKDCDNNPTSTSDTAINKRTFNVLRMPALDAASPFNVSSSTKQIIPKKRSAMLPNAVEVGKKRKMESSLNVVPSSTSTVPSSLQFSHSVLSLSSNQPFSSVPENVEINKSALNEKSKASQQLEAKVQRDEHTYCWSGPCFNNKNSHRIGLSTPSETLASDVFGVAESTDDNTNLEEMVLEEGEIYVDSNGNDIFNENKQHCSQSSEVQTSSIVIDSGASSTGEESSNRVVCFDTDRDTINRRGRKYRKPVELRNSPVREDKNDFFDKIPSHYTALSIPVKQIKKTVFESVSDTFGSQDHLALSAEFDIKDEEEEGEYNKVPAHHRIFTNTSHDVELPPGDEPCCSLTDNAIPSQGRPSRLRRVSSTSRHSGHSTSSHRSNRSGSRYSCGDRSSRSRSGSPAYSDHSPVGDRKSRPTARRRNSSSQLSVSSFSSSCSSNSYCSTCGASLSRSRSRSFSSDRSRERSYSPGSRDSRSRSRSPREKSRMRQRRSSRSFTPENNRSRWRSRSRSSSPMRRRRTSYRTSSRSRRHQMKERSSAERKVMELRKQREEEKIKAMEERRVVYVGKLPDNYTKHQLRKRFECFGDIKGVRLNFRVHGDNYGFVTFAYASDAFAAKEKGNSIPGQTKFDLCFGGRRRFCPDKYADLDGNREIEEEYAPIPNTGSDELDYAALLKQHVNQQKKRKR